MLIRETEWEANDTEDKENNSCRKKESYNLNRSANSRRIIKWSGPKTQNYTKQAKM
jgi:hypothetical protein